MVRPNKSELNAHEYEPKSVENFAFPKLQKNRKFISYWLYKFSKKQIWPVRVTITKSNQISTKNNQKEQITSKLNFFKIIYCNFFKNGPPYIIEDKQTLLIRSHITLLKSDNAFKHILNNLMNTIKT